MIKTVLVALNAKYVHSSLALRYIQKYSIEYSPEIMEFSINDNIHNIYSELLKKNSELYAFSCYIWNIELTLKVAEMLKKAMPDTTIILGGPEVSYTPDKILNSYEYVDGVIVGEGEETFLDLLKALNSGVKYNCLSAIPGLYTRNADFVYRKRMDLCDVKQPYCKEDIEKLKGKIIYFETSRGCPFNCSFCLSSKEENVRPFPMDYVKKGLGFLLDERVPLIKLIDRTFNYNNSRAIEIIKFIIENNKESRVHMELEPGILTDEFIDILNSAPTNTFQVEMGIQSTNPLTLNSIGRRQNDEKTAEKIIKLKSVGKIHVHLDLIAGLPYEDLESFKKSFNYVYDLRPDMLQLGFLKVLKGTDISQNPDVISAEFPPYEVISTKWLTSADICSIKMTEEAVEKFYNSGAFSKTLEKIIKDNPYEEFEKLGKYLYEWQKAGKLKKSILYQLLYEKYGSWLKDALAIDFIMNNKGVRMPDFANPQREKGFKDITYRLLKSDWFCEKYEIEAELSQIRFERIDGIAYMMDYSRKKLFDITDEVDKSADL